MFQDLLLQMLVKVLGQLVTPEAVKKAEEAFVCWLQSQVANSANKIDDEIVKIIAEALGIDCQTVKPV